MSSGSKEFSDNANRIGGSQERNRCKNFQKGAAATIRLPLRNKDNVDSTAILLAFPAFPSINPESQPPVGKIFRLEKNEIENERQRSKTIKALTCNVYKRLENSRDNGISEGSQSEAATVAAVTSTAVASRARARARAIAIAIVAITAEGEAVAEAEAEAVASSAVAALKESVSDGEDVDVDVVDYDEDGNGRYDNDDNDEDDEDDKDV
ncbi:hypothetical protein HZH66_000675 [Vespula vulgaris]|uniref:Uncharacterized protein n=1 Tax=Vespula vulgaris TaxID=7454 RepID=A0A834KV04_VESVU|nr:hypothetical protein HZH66_000675 [Vespula vulgaris]